MTTLPALALVQDAFPVGAIEQNAERIIAKAQQAEPNTLVLFPELTLTGYPPEDLLLRSSLQARVEQALASICAAKLPQTLVFGLPWREEGNLYNCLVVVKDGDILHWYRKRHLPNYQVFDEQRYFTAGDAPLVIDHNGQKLGLLICEDCWVEERVSELTELGAEHILVANASPWHLERHEQRLAWVKQLASQFNVAIAYVNLFGGQDELVFDGSSIWVDAQGEVIALGSYCDADVVIPGKVAAWPSERPATVWPVLVTGLRDYVNRNGFPGVVLGLSGGIDSGLSLAIAVDALGAERVEAVMMPFRYTSEMSIADAAEQANILGVGYRVLSVEPGFDAVMETLAPEFVGQPVDVTEQNVQSRLRGLLLMSLSNKLGHMVLTTGNKSEMAVGYATLYGDMCGGYNALKDCSKTLVWELSRWRNEQGDGVRIPWRVIERPPSAELAPGQKDEDSLPPYDILDAIIHHYVECDVSAEDIIKLGFEREDVLHVVKLIDRNEYKRRQAPEGVRITPRGFGKDRRYPITQGWQPGI
ncbi:NAD+ synthase [Salinibius halmophilus]|uniref:NAD+ synthase n=1 Tax=Salinibius halmophilus TaxID=1853216 RepID=UPI000E660AEC|nr:NAD+ synthase [Salinibius halmophilus]